MKKVNYLEAGDKIYILDGDESVEVVLTKADLTDESTTDPKFLYKKTRLKSLKVEKRSGFA